MENTESIDAILQTLWPTTLGQTLYKKGFEVLLRVPSPMCLCDQIS